MTKRILLFIVAMICNPFFIFASNHTTHKPIKILLLHSYAQNLSWTTDENDGFFDVIENSHYNFDVTIDYMDTKQYSSDSYYALFDTIFKHKHVNNDYDLIAVTDDNALRYLLSIKNDYFTDTPLFFCGSNSQIEYDFHEYKNIYGIYERTSLTETVALIKSLQPNLDTIYFLFDESKTAELSINDLGNQIVENNLSLHFEFLTAPTLNTLVNEINFIESTNSAFIYGFYMIDSSGIVFDPDYSAKKLVKSTDLPIYALWDFSMGSGVIGGKLISGHKQGSQMAKLIIQHLENNITEPLLDASLGNSYMIDYSALKRFDLENANLPPHTIILNKPTSFFERYRVILIITTSVTLLLITYIIILKIQIKSKTQTIEKTISKMTEYKRQASLSNLVRGVAHDINTPLGNIITLTDFAKTINSKTTPVNTKLGSALSKIEQSAFNIKEIITNFKQISIDTAQVAIGPLNNKSDCLGDAIQFIVTLILSERNESIQFEIKGEKTIKLPISSQHLYSIIEPLIHNSISHGFIENKTSKIIITLSKVSQGVQILYEDNGTGIDAKHIDYLFEPFYSTAKHKKHSGLGLFGVYNTVVAYYGNIVYIPKEESGATFLITLPDSTL